MEKALYIKLMDEINPVYDDYRESYERLFNWFYRFKDDKKIKKALQSLIKTDEEIKGFHFGLVELADKYLNSWLSEEFGENVYNDILNLHKKRFNKWLSQINNIENKIYG